MYLIETFNKCDEDGDGFLSVMELNNAMMSLGFNHSEVELQDMILDADENGR